MSVLTGSIVIFNERIEILTKAVNSFLEGTTDSVLYLIDNSPTDKVSHLFNHPRIIYKFNDKNIGFGRGHNIAIREGMKRGSEYHLVLNPDVYFDNTVIEDLHFFLNQNKDVGLIIPKVRYPDGRIQLVCRLLPDPWILLAKRFSPFYGGFLACLRAPEIVRFAAT